MPFIALTKREIKDKEREQQSEIFIGLPTLTKQNNTTLIIVETTVIQTMTQQTIILKRNMTKLKELSATVLSQMELQSSL